MKFVVGVFLSAGEFAVVCSSLKPNDFEVRVFCILHTLVYRYTLIMSTHSRTCNESCTSVGFHSSVTCDEKRRTCGRSYKRLVTRISH